MSAESPPGLASRRHKKVQTFVSSNTSKIV